MESIQKIILISGIPSSGKTIFSRNLNKILGWDLIEADYIYFDIAKKLGISGIKSFPNCSEWWKYDKDILYTEKIREYSNRLTDNNMIIEGFSLSFLQDRNIIKKRKPKAEIYFLFKKVNYYQWLQQKNNSCTKLDCDRTKMEYEDLMNKVQFSNDVILI